MRERFFKIIFFHIITQSKIDESHYFLKNYGSVREISEIDKISKKCIFGINPESIGLSVIHYMSLGLVPIINNNLYKHGPEVIDNCDSKNTIFYKYNNAEECAYEINKLLVNHFELKKAAIYNFERSKNLHKKNLSKQLYEHLVS